MVPLGSKQVFQPLSEWPTIQEPASIQRLGRQMDQWIRRPGRFAFALFGRNETKNSQVLSEFLGPEM